MDDLKERITTLLHEIEYEHLLKTWRERLIAQNVDEADVNIWAAEIRHVVEACQSTLESLAELLQETDAERIPVRINDWIAFVRDIPVFKIMDAAMYLHEKLEKYLPPEEDDDEEAPLQRL